MLVALIIKNLAVIKNIEIEFSAGLSVFTGETGAGKSIIIDALAAVLGGRVSKDIIRDNEKSTLVEACFFLSDRPELNEYLCDNMLNISREIFRDGRNVVKINGALSTTAVLRELAPYLISIHSQNDNQILFNEDRHYKFLDLFAGGKNVYEQYLSLYNSYTEIEQKISEEISKNDDNADRSDYLRFVVNEIESAGINADEEENLKNIKQTIKNYEKNKQKIDAATLSLYDDEQSAYNFISFAEGQLSSDDNFSEISERLNEIKYEIAEISDKIKDKLEEVDTEYSDIDKLENRLNVIYQLKMKYGGSVSAVFERLETSKNELFNIENKENILRALYAEKEKIGKEIAQAAEKLSKVRKEKAEKLAALIEEQLKELMMPRAKFEIKLHKEDEYRKCGSERVSFLFSANAGISVAPLSKIASGGEISRVNLAMKSILTGIDPACAFVFDEIDNGISGRAAQKTAEKMYNLARNNQILCVTHLPQIAAMADNHILVEKLSENDQTTTSISLIEDKNRATELARMIGGVKVTELTMKNASEMLKMAKEYKV